MNSHDKLCRSVYQRYTDPKHCVSCDLIWAVREDDKKAYDTSIGKLEAAYIRGREDTLERIKIRFNNEVCGSDCVVCEGIYFALSIMSDEFNDV